MIVQSLAGHPATDGRRGRGYFVFDPVTCHVVVVDPPGDPRGVRAFLESHSGALAFVASTGASGAGHEAAREIAGLFGVRCLAPGLPIEAGEAAVALGRHAWRIRTAPDGEVGVLNGSGALFTGRALLAGEIPMEAEPARFRARAGWLREILGELPARTRIYPGLGPASEVGLERTCNQELWG